MNHLLETLVVSLNLSSFGFAVLSFLFPKKSQFKNRFSIFFSYFIFYALLIISVGLIEDFQLYFSVKQFLFAEKCLILPLSVLGIFWFFWKDYREKILILVIPFLSWYLFFLLFGREKFSFGSWNFFGFHLFQAQNPILFTCFFPFLFITRRFILLPSFLVLLGFSFIYSYYDKLKLQNKLSITPVYIKYSSCDFFLSGSFLIVEEERGVYFFIRHENVSEPIYKFTMKPLRYLSIYERLYVQKLVQEFQFPIVLKEEETILIYEMYKNYRGEFFKVEFNFYELTGKVKGPIF